MAGRSPKNPHGAEGIMKVGRSVLWIEKKLDRKPPHAHQSLHGATLLRLIQTQGEKVLNLIRLIFERTSADLRIVH